VAAAAAVAFIGVGSASGGALRDDTDLLQAKLDAGGAVFLPKLPGGECYATRGLWLSRDDTTITSDGACIVALGLGPARLDPTAPKPHFANAVFYVTHSTLRAPVPARVSISGLHITVPKARRMHGIAVFGHEVSLSNLTIDGAPLDDVLIGSGVVGAAGPIVHVALADSTLRGAQRDGVLAFGPVGLRVEGNTVTRARGGSAHSGRGPWPARSRYARRRQHDLRQPRGWRLRRSRSDERPGAARRGDRDLRQQDGAQPRRGRRQAGGAPASAAAARPQRRSCEHGRRHRLAAGTA